MLRSTRKGLQIRLESASNDAVQHDLNGFLDVPSGTELTFSVWLTNPGDEERVPVILVDEAGQELDHGTVGFVYVDCPIII